MEGAPSEKEPKHNGEAEGWCGTGTCKWFNVLKGWGFVSPDTPDERGDIFVHQSVVKMSGFRSLGEGEKVKFAAKATPKGYEATEVTGPDGDECAGSPIRPLGNNKGRRMRCFNCGQYGSHKADKCPLEPQPKSCYRCHDTGHLIGACPQPAPKNTGKARKPRSKQSQSDGSTETNETDKENSTKSPQPICEVESTPAESHD